MLQAFSKYQAVNDGLGLVVHSCLLVPYYSWCATDGDGLGFRHAACCTQENAAFWTLRPQRCFQVHRKHSHRRHHSNTGNVAKDEVR